MSTSQPKMKERPIIFSAPMIRAILSGVKTQTRRVVKVPQWLERQSPDMKQAFADKAFGVTPCLQVPCADGSVQRLRNPWHWPEPSRLWVRETFAPCLGGAEGPDNPTLYRADNESGHYERLTWKSPIFMPRWASRITLEITNVRVERLQEISEADAKAEGAVYHDNGLNQFKQKREGWSMTGETDWNKCLGTARFAFGNGWNSLNAKRGYSWASNPHVWVIEFKKL